MCAYSGWMKSQGAKAEDESVSDEAHEAMIERFKAMEQGASDE